MVKMPTEEYIYQLKTINKVQQLIDEMKKLGLEATITPCQEIIGFTINIDGHTTYNYEEDTRKLTIRWRKQLVNEKHINEQRD